MELHTCRSESGALMSDLKLLLQENGILQNKLNHLHSRETDRLSHTDQYRHTIESFTQKITQHEATIHLVTKELRSRNLEVDRVNLLLTDTNDKLIHAKQHDKSLQSEIVRLNLELTKRDETYRTSCSEVDGWKLQNEELVRTVERLRTDLITQTDNETAQRRELSNVRQLAQLTESARCDTQRAAAEQLNVINGIRNEKERVERERDSMKVECDGLKLRLHHLELLITTLRREQQQQANQNELNVENKVKMIADLNAQLQRLTIEFDERCRELERLRVEKDAVLNAVRGGAGGLQDECVRLTRQCEVLEEDKKKLKGYLLRYERQVKRLEVERDRAAGGASGGGGGSAGSAAGDGSGGSEAVEAVRRRVEGKEREDGKRDER